MEYIKFNLEGKEFVGQKEGQKLYEKYEDQLLNDVYEFVFPEDCEVSASFIRGFVGLMEGNAYVIFSCPEPTLNKKLKEWKKDFIIHFDKKILEKPTKK